MKTIKYLLVLLIIFFTYGFSFYHFADNNRNASFYNLFSKRFSDYKMTGYIAFSHWLDKIESNKTKSEDVIDQDWLSTVIENIKKEEYNITYSGDLFAYQSPNRANNYRFVYFKDGFSVSPMMTKIPLFDGMDITIKEKDKKYKKIKDWKITMRLNSFGKKGNMKSFNGDCLTAEKNTAYIEDDNLKINYKNDEEGMRQDFVVKQKHEGEGFLKLRMSVRTKLKVVTGDAGVIFKESGDKEVLKYNSLKVWDAEGKELKGWFEKGVNNSFNIVVNDEDAVYPITIDPLSSIADWTAQGGQSSAYFGCSVSSAGNVNGDGYSDVIVGAYLYYHVAGGGAAFIFHGSETGLSASADRTIYGDVYNGHLGMSVSTAGDVNGDGYSDVVIGAPNYKNGENEEGAAFVYHGSPSGLSTTAAWMYESNQAYSEYGCSVSSAGDVNGDGCSDVIVGAKLFSEPISGEGKVFVYYGHNGTGLSAAPDWTALGTQLNAYYGSSVSNAGDIDRDGYGDIIIGAPGYNPEDPFYWDAGKVFVYCGSSSGLETTPVWTYTGEHNYDELGTSVSTAGDVDGDGYCDIIISIPGYDQEYEPFLQNIGSVIVFKGSASGLPPIPCWSVEGDQAYAYLGNSVSTAGDINGDGFCDVIAGAYWYDNGQQNEGRAYVYYGSSSGLDDTPGWTKESNQSNAYYGICVSTAGDVNGDGFSDVIVGADHYNVSYSNEGAAFVYHGSSGGLTDTEVWTAQGYNIKYEYYGRSVSTAGDVNGDGYSDIIIGAPGWTYEYPLTFEGKVYVFHGSENGLSTTADWIHESNRDYERLGYSVSTAGDVNGDGYSDIIIGAPYYSYYQTYCGRAVVYYGSENGLTSSFKTIVGNQDSSYLGWSVSSAGDVNGDGYSDIIVGAPSYTNGEYQEGKVWVYHGSSNGLSSSANWIKEGNKSISKFGYSVSTAGDVNGDGFSDVIIGAPEYSYGQPNEGMAFVYHGSANGLSTTANWSARGNCSYVKFGTSVSSAGDVNGDGYSDVVIGAPEYPIEGRVYLFYGSSSGLSTSSDWIHNNQNRDFGESVSTAGDVNGDGYSDIVIGAPTGPPIFGGAAYVYYGSSNGIITSEYWEYGYSNSYDNDPAAFGKSVTSGGDINGDGYSDVVIGAPYCDTGSICGTEEGRVFLYYGNEGDCPNLLPKQRRSNLTLVIPPLKSRDNSGLNLGILLRSFTGRTQVKLQMEVQPLGTPFGTGEGSGITESAWYELTSQGIAASNWISGLTDKTLYKWRMRVKYHPSDAPPQPYGRWIYNVSSPNGPTVSSIQISDDDNPLPVNFLFFTSSVEKNNVVLKWSTLSEINNQGFSVQRKNEYNSGRDWVEVGFVKGNGTTNQVQDYQYTDKNLQKGRFEYRLKQVDYNGNHEYHYLGAPVSIGVPSKFELGQNYPNSFNPTTKIDFALPTDGRVSLKVYDIVGRLITTLINNEFKTADYYTVEFNGNSLASGVYFYQLITEKNIATKKMLLIK